MKMRNSLAVAVAAAIMAVFLAIGSANAGIVVYGNLGSAGTGSIGSGGNVLTNSAWRAIGFTVGGTNTFLQTATIGMNVNSAGFADVQLDLYSNNAGVPGTSLFSVMQTLAANTLNQPITFNLNQTLSSGSTYWIVVQKTGGTGGLSWRAPSTSTSPTGQNSSSWSNLGAATGLATSNSGATWGSPSTGSGNSISLIAVPEPSTWAMAGVGIAFAATCGEFRRRRRVNLLAS